MGITTSYSGTLEYARYRWPTYLIGYGGFIVLLVTAIFISMVQGWYGLSNLALAILLIIVYFFIASLWAVHKLYDEDAIVELIYETGNLNADSHLIYIDLGLKRVAVAAARRLTTGHISVVDVYNPQLAPASWLSRAVQRTIQPEEDPRLDWRVGSIDLLPLPDQTAPTVLLIMAASEFNQEGDRIGLLKEITRILTPEGTLLLVERTRTLSNWLVLGPAALRLEKVEYWKTLLSNNGFEVIREQAHVDMAHLLVARQSRRLLSDKQLSLFDQ